MPEHGPELNRVDRASSSVIPLNDVLQSAQGPRSPPTQLTELNARLPYDTQCMAPSSLLESSRVPPVVARKPLQRGYSLHTDNVRNLSDCPVVDSRRAVHSVVDFPFHYDYQQQPPDRSALTRSISNHTSFSERDKVPAGQTVSAHRRSKTPGPELMRGTKPTVSGDEMMYPTCPSVRSKTPTYESSSKSGRSLRNRPPISGTPDFIPASQYTGPPQDGFGYPGDENWAAQQALPMLSSSSVSSTVQGSSHTDSTAALLGMKALNPMSSSWTDSPSSNFSEPGRHTTARAVYDEQFYEMPIYLRRLETGFGFRIVGGTEEGSQVSNYLFI